MEAASKFKAAEVPQMPDARVLADQAAIAIQPYCGLCGFCLDRICFGGEGKLGGECVQVPDAGVAAAQAAIAEEEDDGEEVEADGVKEKDIELVMTQGNPRQPDCGLCRFCLDRICFGGEGKLGGECVQVPDAGVAAAQAAIAEEEDDGEEVRLKGSRRRISS